jgi:hypothetical protein
MAAEISSTFLIWYTTTTSGQGSTTIVNPGRSFRVVDVTVRGDAGAVVLLTKSGGGAVLAAGTLTTGSAGGEQLVTSFTSNGRVDSQTDLELSVTTQDVVWVKITCMAFAGQTLVAPDLT